MSSSVDLIPPRDVVNQWPHAIKHLTKAIDLTGGRMSSISVFDGLLNGSMQLWMHPEGALVTQIVVYPTGLRALALHLVGGKMNKWVHHMADIEEWARDKRCDVLEMDGRRGWARVLGWAEKSVSLERRI